MKNTCKAEMVEIVLHTFWRSWDVVSYLMSVYRKKCLSTILRIL